MSLGCMKPEFLVLCPADHFYLSTNVSDSNPVDHFTVKYKLFELYFFGGEMDMTIDIPYVPLYNAHFFSPK